MASFLKTLSLHLSLMFLFQKTTESARISSQNATHSAPLFSSFSSETCNIFEGKWVYDPYNAIYDSSCVFIDAEFNCLKSGRTDNTYLKYTWRPSSCQLSRFDGMSFLNRWRGKKIMFVGDSLSLNQFQSLGCMILGEVPNAKYQVLKENMTTTIEFMEYEVQLRFYRTPYLVDVVAEKGRGTVLMLDSITQGSAWRDTDVLVFNTCHWWTHSGAMKTWTYMKDGGKYFKDMDPMAAFKKALQTWARWVDHNVDPSHTQVLFQSPSPTHYIGKNWNKPSETCEGQRQPFLGSRYPGEDLETWSAVNDVIKGMSKTVTLLDITNLSEYRKDAHPSHFIGPGIDCSHWCLPGLPDTWNQLLSYIIL